MSSPRECSEQETQEQSSIMEQYTAYADSYERYNSSLETAKASIPEKKAGLLVQERRFKANASRYLARLKEVQKMYPAYKKAKSSWDTFNAKFNAKVRPAFKKLDDLIIEFDRLIIEFQKGLQKRESWLEVALRYGDTSRANVIRSEISQYNSNIVAAKRSIANLNASKQSYYRTASYKSAKALYDSVAVSYDSKKKQLDAQLAIRAEYVTAKRIFEQFVGSIKSIESDVNSFKAERDRLHGYLMGLQSACHPKVG
jgi:hypothetical protein